MTTQLTARNNIRIPEPSQLDCHYVPALLSPREYSRTFFLCRTHRNSHCGDRLKNDFLVNLDKPSRAEVRVKSAFFPVFWKTCIFHQIRWVIVIKPVLITQLSIELLCKVRKVHKPLYFAWKLTSNAPTSWKTSRTFHGVKNGLPLYASLKYWLLIGGEGLSNEIITRFYQRYGWISPNFIYSPASTPKWPRVSRNNGEKEEHVFPNPSLLSNRAFSTWPMSLYNRGSCEKWKAEIECLGHSKGTNIAF